MKIMNCNFEIIRVHDIAFYFTDTSLLDKSPPKKEGSRIIDKLILLENNDDLVEFIKELDDKNVLNRKRYAELCSLVSFFRSRSLDVNERECLSLYGLFFDCSLRKNVSIPFLNSLKNNFYDIVSCALPDNADSEYILSEEFEREIICECAKNLFKNEGPGAFSRTDEIPPIEVDDPYNILDSKVSENTLLSKICITVAEIAPDLLSDFDNAEIEYLPAYSFFDEVISNGFPLNIGNIITLKSGDCAVSYQIIVHMNDEYDDIKTAALELCAGGDEGFGEKLYAEIKKNLVKSEVEDWIEYIFPVKVHRLPYPVFSADDISEFE